MKRPINSDINLLYPLAICLLLILVTVAVYFSVGTFDFINFDDPKYIIYNNHVRSGLTSENIIWAFTSSYASNWHPITWISHMIDVEFFGMNSGYHHYTNLFFHLLNTLLLFGLLAVMTKNYAASGITAALFSIHPVHVESVAWVSERKDVLSGFFFFITLWMYIYFIKKQNVKCYILLLISFVFGLMAKPMLVTLPFLLILLDYWPLNRFLRGESLKKLLIEKIPLMALSLISCVITIYAQKSGGAIKSMELYPLGYRIRNASIAYIFYLKKIIVPLDLAVYYPYIYHSIWYAMYAVTLLLILSALAIRLKDKPYLIVGWLWFLGTLVPVIGLVQVGNQSMADRYSYIPSVGIFVSFVWLGGYFLERYSTSKKICIAALCLAGVSMLTWRQVRLWEKSVTLYEHALNATEKNDQIHFLLGMALTDINEIDRAVFHYRKVLEINPNHLGVHNNLGVLLAQSGNYKEAIAHFSKLNDSKKGNERNHYNLAQAYKMSGDLKKAELHFRKAIQINPAFSEAKDKLNDLLQFDK